MLIPWLAKVTPFTLNCPSQFRPGPPPALASCRYIRDYNEVKALGALVNSTRTFEQTDLTYFYSDNFLVLWHRGLRDIASTYVSSIGDSARLFALASLAMADASIACWDAKRHYVFWRPVTAIQEGDNDGNPTYTWRRFVAAVDKYSAVPGLHFGANAVNGAVTRILRLFFGTDHVTFSLTSGNPNVIQKTRTYSRFSEQAEDVVNARIYEGIHFRTADLVGRRQGRLVAKWAFYHFLRPIDCIRNDGREQGDHED